mmetsp:Transcript_32850/g.71689  ORF Transcript_32850/g.71689 Transcript_32850/m.71689 type:complete len:261 (-) Transcript_32850:126-908(-)
MPGQPCLLWSRGEDLFARLRVDDPKSSLPPREGCHEAAGPWVHDLQPRVPRTIHLRPHSHGLRRHHMPILILRSSSHRRGARNRRNSAGWHRPHGGHWVPRHPAPGNLRLHSLWPLRSRRHRRHRRRQSVDRGKRGRRLTPHSARKGPALGGLRNASCAAWRRTGADRASGIHREGVSRASRRGCRCAGRRRLLLERSLEEDQKRWVAAEGGGELTGRQALGRLPASPQDASQLLQTSLGLKQRPQFLQAEVSIAIGIEE